MTVAPAPAVLDFPQYSVICMMLCFAYTITSIGQNFNKEIKAQILIESNSEFYTFRASVLNITPSDYNLKYDYSFYRTAKDGKLNKTSREELFFIKGNEKKALTSLTVNFVVEDKIVIVLLIYDQDGKPIGKDRIELPLGGKTVLNLKPKKHQRRSLDESPSKEGFAMDALVIQKTLTKNGRDFYREFYSKYYNTQIKSPENILIKEVPGVRRNTLITVKVGDQLVWQFFSQPRKEFLLQMAETALQRVSRYINILNQRGQQVIKY